jgi:hypothetical protein
MTVVVVVDVVVVDLGESNHLLVFEGGKECQTLRQKLKSMSAFSAWFPRREEVRTHQTRDVVKGFRDRTCVVEGRGSLLLALHLLTYSVCLQAP